MKIELTLGCLANDFNIDGKTIDSNNPNLATLCHDIILKCKDKKELLQAYEHVIYTIGEYDEKTQDYYDTFDNHSIRLLDNYKEEFIKIDNKFFNEYSLEFLKKLLAKYTITKAGNSAYDILFSLVESLGVMEYKYTCSTCGDSVYTYTIKL